MKHFLASDPELAHELERRGPVRIEAVAASVAETIRKVRAHGQSAVLESSQAFDAPGLTELYVTDQELDSATVEPELAASLELAIGRVRQFHQSQRERILSGWDVASLRPVRASWMTGEVGQSLISVGKAGLYVPGGRAEYPSSVYMNAIPAIEAGVTDLVLATPARRDGSIAPAVRVVCQKLGIRRILKAGGAAAIAGMVLLESCDRIAGPGNAYTNEAKRQLWGEAGFDGYAGPSEVCVIIDADSDPALAAADLLTQIEHAPDNRAFLVSLSGRGTERVEGEIQRLLPQAKDPEAIRQALAESLVIACDSREELIATVNRIAPEHATVACRDPETIADQLTTAGCVLVGEFSAESAGDYLAGPSHTLPTARTGRWQSPVSVADFLKLQSRIHLTMQSASELGPDIQRIAAAEGFTLHGVAAQLRVPRTDHLSEVRGC